MRAAAGLALVATLSGIAVVGRSAWSRSGAARKIGTAAFDSVPPGAQVMVDGHPVGSTPVRAELAAGPHAVEFRLNSATRTQNIEIASGREISVKVDWKARRVGGLQVTSTPTGAKVLVDGRERGITPLTLDDLPAGSHTVQLDSSEGTVRRKVDIAAGTTDSLAESIYPGWLRVSAPIDVTVFDGTRGLRLDDSNRVLLKAGTHNLRFENRTLDFVQTRQIQIEPGDTTDVSVEVPPSTLSVTGPTGAAVFVDGVKAGETPLDDYPVKLGTRDVMVVEPAGATRHATVTVTSKPVHLDINALRP